MNGAFGGNSGDGTGVCGKCKAEGPKKARREGVVHNFGSVTGLRPGPDMMYLCRMRKLRMDELGRLSPGAYREARKRPLLLVLENIRSMHNVGSIFRTADAFLVEKLCLCGYTPRPPHRDIYKTALGATDTVQWEHFDEAPVLLNALRGQGYRVLALEQTEGSVGLQFFNALPDEKIAIVLGNEVEGVSEAALACCDGSVEIPQFGSKHSLNVSVAAGLVLWEFARAALTENNYPHLTHVAG